MPQDREACADAERVMMTGLEGNRSLNVLDQEALWRLVQHVLTCATCRDLFAFYAATAKEP